MKAVINQNYYQGLVIKIIDFKEHDHIIHLLTSKQILVFISKGTRKMTSKNRFALQLGNIVDVEIFKARLNNQISRLKKAHLIFQPPIFKNDTAKVILIIINEINKITTQNELKTANIFNAIKESWKYLGYDFNHHIKTYVIFQLLVHYGIELQLNYCVECQRKNRINGFMFDLGGFTCIYHSTITRDLAFLNAINYLGKNLEKYLEVDSAINQQIYFELNNYLRDFANY